MTYFVYILANATNVAIYVGVTNDLLRRVHEHQTNADPQSFTARFGIHKLVYFEETPDVYSAISREKQLKSWNRRRKNQLIASQNPDWHDLYPSLL